jgi:MSHA biogenesis protein MshM
VPAIAAEPARNGADLLESRLAATRAWLDQEAQSKFSIQLMGTHDPEQLKDLLNSIGKVVEITKIFVYRTTANRRPSLTVLYGSYATPREAREALDKLPASLKANRPILRTVQGVRGEIAAIKQQQAS